MLENETLKQLRQRKSVRVWADRPVSQEVRQALLESAFEAPTAGNQMLYTILEVTDPELKARLAETCDHQPFIATAPVVLVFLADCQRWYDAYKEAGCQPRLPGPGDLMLAASDALIAAQNTVVAAQSMGLGSCYIGDVLEQCETHRQLLGLPDYVMPAAMVVYGYPTQQQLERKKPARFRQQWVVCQNRYHRNTPEQLREMFACQARDAQKQEWDFDSYVQAFCQRKYNSDFSREMSRSCGEYWKVFLKGLKRK